MSWLTSFIHPQKGYQAGQEQLDKYYNQAQGYQQPYNQQGQEQYGNLNDIIKNLIDPQALQDKWSKGYNESEAAKNMENMAQEHGLNAASSMGLMGSNTALNAIQSGTSQIGAQDRQNYLNDLMEKYKTGAGLSQGIYNTGAASAGQMGQNAMNQGQNSAQMSYNQENAPGNMFSGLVGSGLGLAGSALGGPIGSAIGGVIGKKWGLTGKGYQ
jgi:hypothetical protein